jgi:serine/threonine-protein kinase
LDTFVGQRLGKYHIETLVGRGGMATVYRAHDTVLNRSVAIKILEPALAIDPKL